MTVREYTEKVWRFYLRLEKEFVNTLNYVDFATENLQTFSIEYEKQLLSIGSEVDVLCKLLCKELDSQSKATSITEYANILCDCKMAPCEWECQYRICT